MKKQIFLPAVISVIITSANPPIIKTHDHNKNHGMLHVQWHLSSCLKGHATNSYGFTSKILVFMICACFSFPLCIICVCGT